MEQYVKLLYDRLPDDKKMQLVMIMDNAINEMHNNGVISRLSQETSAKMHDPDPSIRIAEKTSLAKSVGKSFIPLSQPLPLKEGGIAFVIKVDYDPKYVNSISICIQGGLEGLYQSELYKRCKNEVMDYNIVINSNGFDTSLFSENMNSINNLYENFNIVLTDEIKGKSIDNDENKPKKKGLFSKLFKKDN